MWKRSSNVPFPSVWRRFKGRKKINGVIPSFFIQDIPTEEYDNVVNFMINIFCDEEPLTKYSDLLNDEESIVEMKKLWYDVLKDKLGIICYMENPDAKGKPVFVGLNCTHKKILEDDNTNNNTKLYNGKAHRKVMGAMDFIMKKKNAFKELDCNVLLSAMGLYVLPEFRGQNIGLELLLAREDLCKSVGIKACVTVFTATTSQILSNRAGYKILYEISYEDLEAANSELSFPGIQNHTKSIQYNYKIIT